jgi:diguanylate cyclase (GGDEF)-like protein
MRRHDWTAMFENSGELDPSLTATVLRLLTLAYIGTLAPLLGVALPRDAPVRWSWVALGIVLCGVLLAIGVGHVWPALGQGPRRGARAAEPGDGERSTVPGGLQGTVPSRARAPGGIHIAVPSRPMILLENAVNYIAVACFSVGLSGSVGIYRIIFLAPLLFIAATGTRAMAAASFTMCLVTLGASSAWAGVDPAVVPALLISYGTAFGAAAMVARTLAKAGLVGLRGNEDFARLSIIAAQADSVADGMQSMLEVIGTSLRAGSVAAFDVHARRTAAEPRFVWRFGDPGGPTGQSDPARAVAADEDRLADVRIAAMDARVLVRDRWTCLPVATPGGVEVVLLIEREAPDLTRRARYEYSLDRIAVQVSVLLTRLSLITRLEALTRTDSLTGLPNRRSLTECLERELQLSRRTSQPVSVVMFDLDHFKDYNDTFGHLAGDEMLRDIADLLRTRLRSGDYVARYGGEEFCAVLADTAAPDASVLFTEIRRRSRELRTRRTVTFSAGIATWDGSEDSDSLIDRADRALYRAKASGRDQIQLAPDAPRGADAAARPRLGSTT